MRVSLAAEDARYPTTIAGQFRYHLPQYAVGTVMLAGFQLAMNRIDWQSKRAIDMVFGATPTEAWKPAATMLALALAAFFATAVCGLGYVAMTQYAARRHTAPWAICTAAAVAAGFFTIQSYDATYTAHVGSYGSRLEITGDELTADGAAWVAKSGHTNQDDLLFDAAGKPETIWTAGGIARMRWRMRALYLLSVSVLALCVLVTVQAVYCATRPRRS